MIRPLARLIPACWLLRGMRPSLTPSRFGGCLVLVVAALVVVVAALVVVVVVAVLVFLVGEGALFPCPHITPSQVERLSSIAFKDQVPVGPPYGPLVLGLLPSGSGESSMDGNFKGAVSTQPVCCCLQSHTDGGPVIQMPGP